MSGPVTAVFRADASPTIGGGHVMRCLTLAHQLAEQGTICSFYSAAATLDTVPALATSGFDVYPIESDRDAFAQALGRFLPGGADLVIFDHYGLDRNDELRVAPMARRLFVIDDLADRPHQSDLLLDPTVGREAAAYAALVNPDCHILTGGDYALLRSAFAALAPCSIARRFPATRAKRLLVSLGLTDVGGVTARVVAPLIAAGRFECIDVVLAAAAASRPYVESCLATAAGLCLHSAEADIATLMVDADLAIGGAGTTSWERCCLGVPTILLQLAQNQAFVAAQLVARGTALYAENPEQAARLAVELADDVQGLSEMSARSVRLIDGQGARRVCEQISAMFADGADQATPMRFRAATIDDAEMLFLWRNDAETRMQSINAEAVDWDDHLRWLSARLADRACDLLVAECGGPIGTVRIDRHQEGPVTVSTLSWTVAPHARGQGHGKAIVRRARPEGQVRALIKRENRASQAIAKAAGLRLVEDGPVQLWQIG